MGAPKIQDPTYRYNLLYIRANQKVCSKVMAIAMESIKDPYQAGYNHPKEYAQVMVRTLEKIIKMAGGRCIPEDTIRHITLTYTIPCLNSLL